MVTGMYHGRSARIDGIGKTFLDHTGFKQIGSAIVLLFFVTFMAALVSHYMSMAWFPWTSASSFIIFFFSELVFIFLVCLILKYVFTARFGGLTGDNFGAMHEISTILFLTVALLWR
jgi:cobalamin synthase